MTDAKTVEPISDAELASVKASLPRLTRNGPGPGDFGNMLFTVVALIARLESAERALRRIEKRDTLPGAVLVETGVGEGVRYSYYEKRDVPGPSAKIARAHFSLTKGGEGE